MPSVAPAPVAIGTPRHVHPGVGTQIEHILEGSQRKRRHRGPSQLHQCCRSLVRLATWSLQVTPQVLPLVIRQFFEPAAGRVIVVGPGIHHGIWNVIVREIWVISVAVKGELENSCPGHLKLVAERTHVRCDEPQILRDERQSTEFSLNRAKVIGTRASHPSARTGRRRSGRDVPSGRESPKVVQANQIHMSEQCTHAVDAPTIARPTMRIPVIDGIAPKLALRTEVVGWDASDKTRPRADRLAGTTPGWPMHRLNREKRKRAGRRSVARP